MSKQRVDDELYLPKNLKCCKHETVAQLSNLVALREPISTQYTKETVCQRVATGIVDWIKNSLVYSLAECLLNDNIPSRKSSKGITRNV